MSRSPKSAKTPAVDIAAETSEAPDTITECAELAGISTDAVRELAGIKQKQLVVQSYRDKAQELKGKVNQVVHRRVMQDYDRRHAELERQAVPLRTTARTEYARLRSLHEQLQKAFDEVNLDKQELDFRHEVGELDSDELKDRLQECELVLERRRGVLAQAEALKEQFIAAFHSRQELEAGSDSPSAATPVSTSTPAPTIVPLPAVDPMPASSRTTPPVIDDETRYAEPVRAPQPAGAEPNPNDATFVVPDAVLLVEHGEAPVEHRLSVLNYIGRTKDNQVQIAFPGVSRRHALVSAGPGGFTLADLGSQNGTLVNDKPVTQCTLKEGDRIKIGEVQLVFHLARPSGA
jgi:hypothetical protein